MGRVELLTGPAGASKTARALAIYRRHVRDELKRQRFGTALWIAPSWQARQTVFDALLDEESPICLDPRIMTFGQFVEDLLAATPTDFRRLSQVGRRKLLRDVIEDLLAAGQLPELAGVAASRGFLDHCLRFIAELKREEIWPEAFRDVFAADSSQDDDRRSQGRASELAAIYELYQQRLHLGHRPLESPEAEAQPIAGELYDGEGQYWIARKLLRAGQRGPFAETRLVVVDGFTDFTGPQIEILGSLAETAERLVVTLPLETPLRRDDLFAKSAGARAKLRQRFAESDCREYQCELTEEQEATTLGHLARHLFANPQDIPRRERTEGCELIACIRASGEIEEVLRRVKRLLLSGTRPERIAIVSRQLDAIVDRLVPACQAAGIPTKVGMGPLVTGAGPVRAALGILDLERQGWTFAGLLGLLHSSYFRPRWELQHADIRRIGREARAANWFRGRVALLGCLDRLAEREQLAEGDRDGCQRAAALLHRLSEELAPLRKEATFGAWIDRWLAICTALGIPPSASDDRDETGPLERRARAGWDSLRRLIEDARKVEAVEAGPRNMSLGAFRDELDELVNGQRQDPIGSQSAGVRLLSAEEARHVEVDHLFLCGMGEGEFPGAAPEELLLGDAERNQLADAGLELAPQRARGGEEMLLFYSVAARPRQSLTLSYRAVNEQGESLNPSPYLLAIQELFEGGGCPITEAGRLDPVPAARGECLTESQARLVATRELTEGSGGLFRTLAGRAESGPAMRNLAAALRMARARFATPGLTNFEGMLTDPQNLQRLADRYRSEHQFSVTELENFADDPFQFFLTKVLGVEVLEAPRLKTNRLERGSRLHQILYATHEALHDAGGAGGRASLIAKLRERLGSVPPGVDRSPLGRTLTQIESEILADYAQRYANKWLDYQEEFDGLWDLPPQPAKFEVTFGDAPGEEGQSDTARYPAMTFAAAAEAIQVRGKIDRIDIGMTRNGPVFNIIDYKLGKEPQRFSEEDFTAGRALQLVVYAVATRKLGLVAGDLFQFGLWGLGESGFRTGLATRARSMKPLDPVVAARLQDELGAVIGRLVEAMRSGAFAPRLGGTPAAFRAPYRAVARASALEAVAEPLRKRPDGQAVVDAVEVKGV